MGSSHVSADSDDHIPMKRLSDEDSTSRGPYFANSLMISRILRIKLSLKFFRPVLGLLDDNGRSISFQNCYNVNFFFFFFADSLANLSGSFAIFVLCVN